MGKNTLYYSTEFNICDDWKDFFQHEFNQSYMQKLNNFLEQQKLARQVFFPLEDQIFSAFRHTSFHDTHVVILGQDPYHKAGQAHGLSFSVQKGVKIPPSLKNIFLEIQDDLKDPSFKPVNGHLNCWAEQGVLLLNQVLTVPEGMAGGHHKKGWEKFTDSLISHLSQKKEGVIFILWGSPAQKKIPLIDQEKHHILLAPHPSPLSSYRGFFKCKHFSQTNQILLTQGKKPIIWNHPALLS